MSGLRQAYGDGRIVAWRNLKRVPRIPELAIFAVLQSIMFVLLFVVVFGGAIPIPGGGSYTDYFMPGIFVQTMAFASATTAIGMTEDISRGIIDRFRSLPMARSAVLTGRSISDIVYNAGILVVLMITGLLVGWRVDTTIGPFLFGVVLLIAFAFVMSWIGIWLGLMVPTVEVAQQVVFIVIFPLTFISNVFVPVETLPDWLQPIAEWNPISTLTAAVRELWGNPNPFPSDSLPAQYPIAITIAWMVVLLAVFAPLGVRRYRAISR
jgi:ABC transporter DrrB family efflux protein